MKILVMGSGGVGGYFGGRLAAAGNDVTFVARGAHLAALKKDGLLLDSQIGNATISPAKAVQDPAEAGVPDVVMFATKMGDTEGAARQLAPVVKEGVSVITFQNGVEGPDIIRRVLPGTDVHAGVARIASHISRPGVIEHRSPFARLEMGAKAGPRIAAFHAACKAAGVDAIAADNIDRNVWVKFALLAPFSGLTTLTGHTAGPLRENPKTLALVEAAVREVIAVSRAAGTGLTDEDFAAVTKAFQGNPPAMTSSMAHDHRAGKPLELEWLSGAVVRIGERHGVATPTHRFITQALAIDAGGEKDLIGATARN
jgi:2-dehydropantoate 2-reductase